MCREVRIRKWVVNYNHWHITLKIFNGESWHSYYQIKDDGTIKYFAKKGGLWAYYDSFEEAVEAMQDRYKNHSIYITAKV